MARIRSFHPELWTDEDFTGLSPLARLLLLGLQTHADDQGVFRWKPRTLKAQVLPVDQADVDDLLGELERAGLVRRFTEGGHDYGAIRGFLRHQRPRKPTNTHPLPTTLRGYVGAQGECGTSDVPVTHQCRTGDTPPPLERRGGEGRGEKGRGAGEGATPPAAGAAVPPSPSKPIRRRTRAPRETPDEAAARLCGGHDEAGDPEC